MKMRGLWKVFAAVILLPLAGCYTQFSPEWTRNEIVRQTGTQPGNSFEFSLEGAAMKFAQSATSNAAGGLSRIDLAVFTLPSGRQLDYDRMHFMGWDKLIRTQEGQFNLLVLVRSSRGALVDLTAFAQGEDQLLFGRLEGNLDSTIPSALPGVLRAGGLQGLKNHLLFSVEGNR